MQFNYGIASQINVPYCTCDPFGEHKAIMALHSHLKIHHLMQIQLCDKAHSIQIRFIKIKESLRILCQTTQKLMILSNFY